jgi:excisionase family DNA binding protein
MMTMEVPKEKVMLTPEQVAQILNVSERKVADMLRSGKIPSTKVGRDRRVSLADLDAFILENRQGA